MIHIVTVIAYYISMGMVELVFSRSVDDIKDITVGHYARIFTQKPDQPPIERTCEILEIHTAIDEYPSIRVLSWYGIDDTHEKIILYETYEKYEKT